MNDKTIGTEKFIIYWMQASQRVKFNPALEYAVELANRYSKAVLVFFGMTERYPDANLRHYSFMFDGLRDVSKGLEKRGIGFIVRLISPEKGVISLSRDVACVVVDRGYLRIQKQWRAELAKKAKCPVFQVEGDVLVPVEVTSKKEEFSAHTIRPKIKVNVDKYLKTLKEIKPKKQSLDHNLETIRVKELTNILNKMDINRSVEVVSDLKGGYGEAKKRLKVFIERKLNSYDKLRRKPKENASSNLSPYLHFGHISPIEVALSVINSKSDGVNAFLDELVVRRELAVNFVNYNIDYDNFDCLDNWAKKTLLTHAHDKRKYKYSIEDLENGETHDPYWNAAQKEMRLSGYMHGYMRMYWGKKILEWTENPKDAFQRALILNNKYELDGRDPNGYAGVAWCFGKHDRPWKERSIFGKVRYMNDKGLERKFDMKPYMNKWISYDNSLIN